MIYLSGVSTPALRDSLPAHNLGHMWTPGSHTPNQHVTGAVWAADNECFTLGPRFEQNRWAAWLAEMQPWADQCLFAVAPDVVGDAAATIERSRPYYATIRAAGYRPAFVLQNGQEHLPVPWNDVDAVFIGGDTEWKLSRHACALAYEAKDRGKWVHMGRVNSLKRLRRAAEMGCDSADGTFLKFAPDINIHRLRGWLHELNHRPVLDLNQ